ncbi:MAG TPA: DSD1 family PLP-dependent enzyme [Phycisphaerae bacterium]|nr:DSD1 family PLP-dependent enzyme [Phycisphaerae bacterium]
MAGISGSVDRTFVGRPIEDLDTPALCLDADVFEANLKRMADFFRGRPARLRPHFKNNKCVQIAKRQLAAGACVGITCAKLGEAEVLSAAGCEDILIANQIIGSTKIERLVDLARRTPTLRIAVDDADNISAIAEAAGRAGITIGLLVEVDIGMNRCGVSPGEPAVQLARQIGSMKGVRFDGLQAYEGHLVAVANRDERGRRVREDMAKAIDTRRLIETAGIEVPIISGGSTSTYDVTGSINGVTEVQAGTYPTMDHMYVELTPEFQIALSILSRVISRPKPGVAVLDVGLKGAGHEFGPPKVKGMLDAPIPAHLSEEHCTIENSPDWKVGQSVELIPSHSCTTCNLYRRIHVHQHGRVVDVWPIEASGCLA